MQNVHVAKQLLKNIMQQHLRNTAQDECNFLLVPNVSCMKVTEPDKQKR
jgi:hypothetical protein